MLFKNILITLLLSLPFVAQADVLSGINRYLVSTDGTLKGLEVEGSHIQDRPDGLAKWLNGSQVSFENRDDFTSKENGRQSYSLDVKPKAWGQSDAEYDLLVLKKQSAIASYRKLRNATFNWRYRSLLNLVAETRQLNNANALKNVAVKQVQYNRNLVNSAEFNESSLLNAELMLDEANSLTTLHQNRVNNLMAQFDLPNTQPQGTMFNWLIDIHQMQSTLASMSNFNRNPDIQAANLALAEAKAEYHLKKTEQKFGVDRVRVQVLDNEDRVKPVVGFMVGVNIPLGENTYQNIKGTHDIHEAQIKLIDSEIALKQTLLEKRLAIDAIVEEHQATQGQLQTIQGRLAKDYAKTIPRIALYLQSQYNKKLAHQASLEQKAMVLYLDYLEKSGLLTAQPFRNWLHKDLIQLQTQTASRE